MKTKLQQIKKEILIYVPSKDHKLVSIMLDRLHNDGEIEGMKSIREMYAKPNKN